MDAVQTLTFAGPPAGGTFTLTYFPANNGAPILTNPIAYGPNDAATEANIQAELNTDLGVGNTLVTNPAPNTFNIAFQGALADSSQFDMAYTGDLGTVAVTNPGNPAQNAVQTLTFTAAVPANKFTLTFTPVGGNPLTTLPITYSAVGAVTANNIAAALNKLIGAGSVTATSPAANTYTITFVRAEGFTFQNPLVLSDPAATIVTTTTGVALADTVQTLEVNAASSAGASFTLTYTPAVVGVTVPGGAGQNAVQTLTFSPTDPISQFTLTYSPAVGSPQTTAPIPFTRISILPDEGNSPFGAMETGNTVTITTASPTGFAIGQTVTIRGVDNAGYDGTFVITGTPTATSFTYTDATSGLASAGGGVADNLTLTASSIQNALDALPNNGKSAFLVASAGRRLHRHLPERPGQRRPGPADHHRQRRRFDHGADFLCGQPGQHGAEHPDRAGRAADHRERQLPGGLREPGNVAELAGLHHYLHRGAGQLAADHADVFLAHHGFLHRHDPGPGRQRGWSNRPGRHAGAGDGRQSDPGAGVAVAPGGRGERDDSARRADPCVRGGDRRSSRCTAGCSRPTR